MEINQVKTTASLVIILGIFKNKYNFISNVKDNKGYIVAEFWGKAYGRRNEKLL